MILLYDELQGVDNTSFILSVPFCLQWDCIFTMLLLRIETNVMLEPYSDNHTVTTRTIQLQP